MIERWFPCAEVSEHSAKGWGTGFAEKSLFTWFASRPLAQAKAAVICSLLPWPDDEHEQESLKELVREAMADYDAKNSELRKELAKHYPNGAKMCDPFSGRAMIPLEAARLGIQAWGIDYSPVATLAGKLWLTTRCATGTTSQTCRSTATSSTRPSTSPNRDSYGMCASCLV